MIIAHGDQTTLNYLIALAKYNQYTPVACANSADLLEQFRRHKSELVVLDSRSLPGARCTDLVRQISGGGGKVVVLAEVRDEFTSADIHSAGALWIRSGFRPRSLLSGRPSPKQERASCSTPPLYIGCYIVVREIGTGGMGRVFLARDPQSNGDVAIKVLAAGIITDQARSRLRAEAQILSALNHPGIIAFRELGKDLDMDFLVCEHVAGFNLRQARPQRFFRSRWSPYLYRHRRCPRRCPPERHYSPRPQT